MSDPMTLALSPEWKERLGLANRQAPELYDVSASVVDAPHASAIRVALDDLQVSAVFCVQTVPTIAILVTDTYDRKAVVDLHGALWNQGLISLLLVISGEVMRAFSLARTPLKDADEAFENRCLVDTLTLTADALRFRNIVDGAESGRLWSEHAEYFKPKERIDQVLLDNLKVSHTLLRKEGLHPDPAQALLIQAMFIAYLEDRDIISAEYFRTVSSGTANSFLEMLGQQDVSLLQALFATLKADFNGDIFVAPCSFEPQVQAPEIRGSHLDILASFRLGREEMAHGQHRFWGYDFRYIPVELVSAVYDRFLGEKEAERRATGAFYTPMFLADTVVSQVWDMLSPAVRDEGRFLDPACGSGVFLVRSFQRLCEHWRSRSNDGEIAWDQLLGILRRVHGWDINGSAVRVAVFSLYVALLEEVSPRDIRRLISRGKVLPELWGHSLICRDFFAVPEAEEGFDLIIGNPPWTSRRGPDRSSVRWSKAAALPMPGKEDAWAFTWKAGRHLAAGGVVAFLLPSMGFLHNHSAKTVAARNQFMRACRIRRIINFADLRFQLFEHAHRPAALVIYGAGSVDHFPYTFDYWAPKADLNLRIKRVITLSSADKMAMSVEAVLDNPLAFKQRLWMREPDAKLFGYLARLSKIGDLVADFGSFSRRRQNPTGHWVIGQGYQPFTTDDDEGDETAGYAGAEEDETGSKPVKPQVSQYVGTYPDLPIGAFRRLAQADDGLHPAISNLVRRRGFEPGFAGVRILVPRGVETSQTRLRAAYCQSPLTFQDILQAIIVPSGEERQAKLLTAILNSRLSVWYAFHGTASFGSDRPEVKQAELRRLPFPELAELPDPDRAARASDALVAVIDSAMDASRQPFTLGGGDDAYLGAIDRLTYDYFCLSDDEIVLIDDAVDTIIPAIQPHEGASPGLWKPPLEDQRRAYAETLAESLRGWLLDGGSVGTKLVARSVDLAILRITLEHESSYSEDDSASLTDVLGYLSEHINQPLDGNFQLIPDLRVFVGDSLYLIKPMQMRFWLRAAALADADSIAMDLQDAITIQRQTAGT
ncbi:MAG: N-6 DNA methylase [Alphaproteobacteria bacterium HGW-Alphaproteobacteria-16]|nr:MAG: N-6 DNA methylase [Alphaproteobacteria bacterium HGW-Alphaproteobacteria-16]